MNLQKTFILHIRLRCCIAIAAFVVTLATGKLLHAQQFNSRNIATFTAGQAAKGKTAYGENCASCHGQNLNGGDFASALRGPSFSQSWGGKSAESLFTYITTKMPPENPGQLDAQTTAQLVAYILQGNGVQPGDKELPSDTTALAAMTIPRGATQRSGADDASVSARSSDAAGHASQPSR